MDPAVDSAAETALLEALAALDLGSEHPTPGGGEPLRAGGGDGWDPWNPAHTNDGWGRGNDLEEVDVRVEDDEGGDTLEASGLTAEPNNGTDEWGTYKPPPTPTETVGPCDAPAGKMRQAKKDGTPTVFLGTHQHEALKNVWKLFSRDNWGKKTLRELQDGDVPIERAAMVYHGLGSGKTVVHAAILDFLSQPGFEGWECYNLSTTENTAQHPVSELYQLMGELSANSAAVKIRREEKDWGAAVREKIRHLITGRKLEGTGASVGAARKVACQKNPRVAQTKKKTPKTSKTPKRTAQPKKPHEIVVLPDTPFLSILSKEGTLQLPAQLYRSRGGRQQDSGAAAASSRTPGTRNMTTLRSACFHASKYLPVPKRCMMR